MGTKAAGWLAAGNLVVSRLAVASPPDYSHLTDAQLRQALVAIAIGLVVFAGVGVYGWLRLKRAYVAAPGHFTPLQALVSVLAIIGLVLLGAAAVLR